MAADWPLSPVQRVSLSRGEILVDADVNFERNRGDVRAAVRIAAPASTIFAVMTDCAAALKFVPHLQRCVVLETGPDRSWELVEHVVDLSWYIPRTRYVFRADYDPGHSVSFHQVRGDLRANEGLWEFVPEDAGTATIVTYRVHIVPRYYVPRWLVRSSLKRELPALLESLRRYCESGAGVAAEGGAK
ncbi:MAG: SRPBCC family protein [Steroidobacteraceae bacterium]